ncbi:unnamed protein product [Adineta ricciae]|uniref:Craniofacial development protein 1 n=1 Tax=Adineta ricciae TaxID=249248 RepID=A0A813VQN0_ADIRI|nr:unnamed protein product [Adineta ricciae]CAF1011886.1 unnamed protein product [Adineta ricciae]
MSEKNLVNDEVDSEDDEDDDYCPADNNKQQSDSSADSEDDDEGDAKEESETTKKNELNVAPYDESKVNELWKNFTSTTAKPVENVKSTESKPATKIFEYAGEKVSVPITTPPTVKETSNPSIKRPAATSGSVLDRLGIGNKKQKLSTLEKSRLDWSAHKDSEALTDDLDSHRRSKDSYVEKKAFLERTELRQHDHFLTHVKKK